MKWEEMEIREVLSKLDTTETGLTSIEAENRLDTYGYNRLIEGKKPSEIKKFLVQFTEPLTVLLIIAGVIAFAINDFIDSGVIFLVVIINAILGYRQENKAENAMEKLKSIDKKYCVVLRDGREERIDTENITQGDIIILEEGDNVPADCRVIDSYDLKINESMLTGESLPVTKISEVCEENSKDNLIFMDTFVTRGRAKAAVLSTGMDTEIGTIATLIQEEDNIETPLQIKIDKLGKTLGLLSVVICILIFLLETLQSIPIASTFMTAVSLAVAAIPEGLPAILTLTLALGMQKMAKNNAIIRKLLAVETLGSCSIVCSDKTGTLTMNKLSVSESFFTNSKMTYTIAYLCNNASINLENNVKIGDETDISILEEAINNGFDNIKSQRLNEIPLDSKRKRMTTINRINDEEYVLIKGAPEILLKKCGYVDNNGKISKLDEDTRSQITTIIENYANDALRVISFAYKKVDNYNNYTNDQLEEDLIFVGLMGLMDLPRKDIDKTIKTCHEAGINVKMITGDHENTAKAIAKKIGIKDADKVLSGPQINKLSNEELEKEVLETNVFARVFPEQKLQIVKILQQHDEIVAMTGDGINDAPALKKANIGVSMGSGSDVAKSSSDMILQDDNFNTIVYAIKEGRTIYSNIKRFIKFQLSTNIAAILTILISTLLYLPIPLNPVQLLWINIIMDGPPAQSLGVEASDKKIMKIPPSDENILSRDNLLHILLVGLVMSAGTLAVYMYELSIGTPQILASTIAFTVFVMYQLFNVFNCKSNSNKRNNTLIIAVVLSFILQICAIYIPALQKIFKTVAIPPESWILILVASLSIFVAEKIIKRFENSII